MLVSGGESFAEQFRALRASSGTVSVESGLTIWRLCLEHGLYDDLWIFVHPAVAGEGEKLFDGSVRHRPLRLLRARTFGSGVVELHCAAM